MAHPPFDPDLKTDPGGNKAIAALVCLCFGFYLIVPSILHYRHVAGIVNHGVEVLAETESCSRRGASRARTVLVKFSDENAQEYRCLASIKTKCKTPFKPRWVTYNSADPNQCLVGRKDVLDASWRSALGLVLSGMMLVLMGAYLTRSVIQLRRAK
ncbi:MAG: hypothetical protein CMH58_01990 [Myxococcales bacterium]|nr:hypothetical protein [Myxococcales bacterium]